MKVCVVSDTHGNVQEVINYLKEQIHLFDEIWHLGDYVSDADAIARHIKLPVKSVKGNCDFRTEHSEVQKLKIHDKVILLCHGHKQHVKTNLMNLYYYALEEGADVVCFGHTHVPVNDKVEDILFFNPGSAAIPRGGFRPSIGILAITPQGVAATHVILKR